MEGLPRLGEGDLEATGADGQHPERAGRRSVTVGAQQCLARNAEALHVHGMAHAVARRRIPDPESAASAPQKEMVVGIAEVGLDQVVVHVLGGQLGPDPVEAHRLQLQHHERPGGVLGERLVDPDRDLGPRREIALDEVRCDELVRDAESHAYLRVA